MRPIYIGPGKACRLRSLISAGRYLEALPEPASTESVPESGVPRVLEPGSWATRRLMTERLLTQATRITRPVMTAL